MEKLSSKEVLAFNLESGRKGADSTKLEEFLRRAAQTIDQLEEEVAARQEELAVLRDGEEAVRLTFAAAVRTRDEMIAKAETEVAQQMGQADSDTARMRQEAEAEVANLRADARREVNQFRAEQKAIADETVRKMKTEQDRVDQELRRMRTAANELEQRLRNLASGAMEEFAGISASAEKEMESAATVAPFSAPPVIEEQLDDGIGAPEPVADLDHETYIQPDAEFAEAEAGAEETVEPTGSDVEAVEEAIAEAMQPSVEATDEDTAAADAALIEEEPAGFYEKGLAGLRRRINENAE